MPPLCPDQVSVCCWQERSKDEALILSGRRVGHGAGLMHRYSITKTPRVHTSYAFYPSSLYVRQRRSNIRDRRVARWAEKLTKGRLAWRWVREQPSRSSAPPVLHARVLSVVAAAAYTTCVPRDEPPTAPSTCSPFTAGTRTSADTSSRCTSPSRHHHHHRRHLHLRHRHHRHHRRHRHRRRRHPRCSPRRPQSSRLLIRVLLRVSTPSLTAP